MRRVLDWDAVTALRTAEAHGIPVILATGNVIPATKTIQHCIGTTGPIICENGGTLYWELPRTGNAPLETLWEVLKDRTTPDAVVEELRRRGHAPRPISSDPWRQSEAALELSSIDEDTARQAVADLGHHDLYVVATGFACHILHKGIDKAVGLQHALDWMNEHDPRFAPTHADAQPAAEPLLAEHVLALGDSMNDVELFQRSGVAGAVANASPGLRAVADIVSDKPHGAGVRDIIARLGLESPET